MSLAATLFLPIALMPPASPAAEVLVEDTSALAGRLQNEFRLNPVRWNDLNLNRQGVRLQPYDMIMRFRITKPHVGFTWESDDQNTKDWYPQGIAGLRQGTQDKFIVVSWYAKNEDKHKGVRLTFCDVGDMSKVRYRHVLLVKPSADPAKAFEPIVIHAGGVAAYGNMLYVAETGLGIRAFDASKIFPAVANPGKNKVGMESGSAYAFDYRYVLPQTAVYRMDAPPYSFVDVDWTDVAKPLLLTGSYHSPGDDDRENFLAWWRFDGGRIGAKVRDTRTSRLSLKNRMQGAASLNGTIYLSCSGGTAHLYVGKAPYTSFREYSWPHGTEDLHLALASGNLWCLSEHPGTRIVWAVKYADYKP